MAGEMMESEERKRDRAGNKDDKMKKEDEENEMEELEDEERVEKEEEEGEEMAKEEDEEEEREVRKEMKVKRTTCGAQRYRDKLELARLIRRRLRRRKARGWAWGKRVVVNYGVWRRLSVDEVLDWAEERGGRDDTSEGGWGRVDEGVARNGDHGDIAAMPKGVGVAGDGEHGNQTPSTRPKKRVSFGLHKNQIFTPQ